MIVYFEIVMMHAAYTYRRRLVQTGSVVVHGNAWKSLLTGEVDRQVYGQWLIIKVDVG